MIEDLGWDRDRKPSSLSLIKRGPNRGRRRKESGGHWVLASSYLSSRLEAHLCCSEWATALIKMEIRVGKLWDDGVTLYYIWRAK